MYQGQNRRKSPESKLTLKSLKIFSCQTVLHSARVSVFRPDARVQPFAFAVLTFSNLTGRLSSPSLDLSLPKAFLMDILIVEDDAPVAQFLSSGLATEHFGVRIATDGKQILPMVEQGPCDLMILDLNLPGVTGWDALRQVRFARPHLPVLILTGSGRVEDRVDGLNSGADDYLTKPFAFSELLARVRALLRRSSKPFEPVLRSLDLELDRLRHCVHRGGRLIELTPKEFALLEYLLLNAGRNVSRSDIIRQVWNLSAETMTNVIDVYINYLRKKIDAGASEKLIQTVRGAGYRLGPKLRS